MLTTSHRSKNKISSKIRNKMKTLANKLDYMCLFKRVASLVIINFRNGQARRARRNTLCPDSSSSPIRNRRNLKINISIHPLRRESSMLNNRSRRGSRLQNCKKTMLDRFTKIMILKLMRIALLTMTRSQILLQTSLFSKVTQKLRII